MHRYYMTPETRQAVIAESNRLIAVRTALHASRTGSGPRRVSPRDEDGSFASDNGAELEATSDSAFARLVADLETTARADFADTAPN